jgi:DNA ligase (NAD+)
MGTRKEVAEKLESLGARALADVRNECNLLIVGEAPGNKLAKAQKKGIKIVDATWVEDQLK